MRDKLKTIEYFKSGIKIVNRIILETTNELNAGLIKSDRMVVIKDSLAQHYLELIFLKYSAGYSINEIVEDWIKSVYWMDKGWVDNNHKFYLKGKYWNQLYLGPYDVMLWMLSIGYLINLSEVEFLKLVAILDRYEVKDYLLDFIICAKVKDRLPITEESYIGKFTLFGKLRQAIKEEDKKVAQNLIKDFLEKDWYKEHKNVGWHDSHKSIHNSYSGYWCFEAAAITKIMELDDSSYRENQYYPKDLADYYDTVK
jgi:hypothetical protein